MQLFYFAVYIFEAIIAYIYFSDNYNKKHSWPLCILVSFGLYICAFIVNIINKNTAYANEIVFFIINVLLSQICFKISFKSSVFHSIFLSAIMFLTEFGTEACASYLFHIPIDAYKNSLSALLIIGIICKTLYLSICKIVSIFYSYKKQNTDDTKGSLVLLLYPFMIIVTLFVLLYASTKYTFSRELNMICAVISVVSLLFCCFIFVYNRFVQKQQSELINLQNIKQKNELNESFYALLEQKNEEHRVLTHDLKHHLFAIDSMQDITSVKQYIQSIQPELEKYQYIGKTDNKMFDLILNKYDLIAKNESIDFETDIRTSNLSFIEDRDLTSLLGNLLDNAFEAAKTSIKKKVLLTTTNEKQFILLSIVNSCSSAPVIDNDKLITTKTDKRFHGYGTKSIEKTAEKYNGICQWNYDKIEMEFHYNILFNK